MHTSLTHFLLQVTGAKPLSPLYTWVRERSAKGAHLLSAPEKIAKLCRLPKSVPLTSSWVDGLHIVTVVHGSEIGSLDGPYGQHKSRGEGQGLGIEVLRA